MEESNKSFINKIKQTKNIKLFLIFFIILIILLSIFLIKKPSPKSTASSFIKALQNYDYDKSFSYIDFERMVMLTETSNDFENLETNLSSLPSKTSDEQGNFKESVSYTKRHITAVIDQLKNEGVFFITNSTDVSEISDNIYKVIINLTIQKDDTSTPDKFTFYIQKQQNKYQIISISDEFYF